MQNKRLERLLKTLDSRPDDPFLLYAIAIEHKIGGDNEEALRRFEEVQRRFPEYVPTYYHYGMLCADMGRLDEAEKLFDRGIAEAEKAGDAHARSELARAKGDLEIRR